tara:strand:+ start:373 stop:495 length:123 start_codon:yes stop_codon:yes gene_type:complete
MEEKNTNGVHSQAEKSAEITYLVSVQVVLFGTGICDVPPA